MHIKHGISKCQQLRVTFLLPVQYSHKLLKTYRSVLSSIIQKSKMGLAAIKSRCWHGCIPSGSSREDFLSLSILAPRNCLGFLPWLSNTSNNELCPHGAIPLVSSHLPPSSIYKDLCDYIRPSWMIQENISILISAEYLTPFVT